MWQTGNGTEKAAQARSDRRSGSQFAREDLGFEPDPLQAAVLDSPYERGILNCSRQWGKSTVAAVKAVDYAWRKPGSLVLIAAPTTRQSGLLLSKAEDLLRGAGMPVKGDGYNELSLKFQNGSRIVGLPGMDGTVRGFSQVSLLLVDEASRVSDRIYRALRPMLAVGDGHLWMMSTPNEKRGFFYETWEYGEEDWHRVKAPATECPRISAKFLAKEKAEFEEYEFRREYMCEFQDSGTAVFSRELVEDAMDDEVFQLEF
jgi:hypothetical protein